MCSFLSFFSSLDFSRPRVAMAYRSSNSAYLSCFSGGRPLFRPEALASAGAITLPDLAGRHLFRGPDAVLP